MDWVKQKMEHARQQRELLHGNSHTNTDQPLASNHDSQTSTRKNSLNTIWLLGAAGVWITTIIAAWLAGSSVTNFDVSSSSPGNVEVGRVSEVVKLKTHIATSRELGKHLDDLNRRIQLLTETITNVEAGLIRVLVLADSMPDTASRLSSVTQEQQPTVTSEKSVFEIIEPTASGTSDKISIVNTEADKLTNDSADKPAADEKDFQGSGKQNSVNTTAESQWFINLASLSDKGDADRFSARARSKDIQVEQYAVTVKGKEYWRVHAGGFSTATEAKYQANIIKKKLGLGGVWITKR